MKRFLKRNDIDLDDYVQSILIGTLVIVAALGLYSVFLSSMGIKDIVLSCMALIMNALLCSIQFYVIFKIFELERDHLNHYDVEKSLRNLVLPEQAIQVKNGELFLGISKCDASFQIFLTIVHAINSSWMLTSVQVYTYVMKFVPKIAFDTVFVWFSVAICGLALLLCTFTAITSQSCFRVTFIFSWFRGQRFLPCPRRKSEEFAKSLAVVRKLGFLKVCAKDCSIRLVWASAYGSY